MENNNTRGLPIGKAPAKWFREFIDEILVPVADGEQLAFVSNDLVEAATAEGSVLCDTCEWPSGNAAGVEAMEEQLNQETADGLAVMDDVLGDQVQVQTRKRNPPRPRLMEVHATRNTISGDMPSLHYVFTTILI